MDKIRISGLEVRCIIGTKPVERRNMQKVLIDIALDCDLNKAAKSDKLEDTINYKRLTDDILEMVAASKCFLLEKLAEKIASLCLSDPKVSAVSVSLDKPGALESARTVGVEIVRSRQHSHEKRA